MALTDNLKAWYKLDEAAGNPTTIADSSGNAKTLNHVNFPEIVTGGKIGNAVWIKPLSEQYFAFTSSAYFAITGDMTVSAWYKPVNLGGDVYGGGIVVHTINDLEGHFLVAQPANGSILFTERRSGGTLRETLSNTGIISTGNWHHVVCRRSGATNTIWVNGTNVTGATQAGLAGWGQSNFTIGTSYLGSAWSSDGYIDLVGLWDRALSDAEIGQLYNGGAGFDYPFTGGGAALTKAVADSITTLGETAVVPVLIPQPTYFGSASVPADGASAVNATTTLTITPPASMLAGDLVAVVCVSGASATWSNGVTGGQTWNALAAYQGTVQPFCRIFWCRFNGTWGANPRFDSTVGTNTSAIMHVFRPPNTTDVWAVDVAQATTQYSAPSTPFTVTRNGVTTVNANTVALACWHSADDNTWGSLAGTGWVVAGSAQYRNTSGTPDNSSSFAYHIDVPTGAVVPNVSKNQATLGGDAGVTAIIAWCAIAPVAHTKEVADSLSLSELVTPVLAGGAALTKSVSDVVVMSDLRSGAAGFARSLPDAMTMNEVLSRLAQYQRAFANAMTMSESIAAVKALARALADPLTMGENLSAVKDLLRAYADALILGELVDKQTIMAAYSDTFNRADSGTPGASWVENVSGVSIASNELAFINTGAYSSVVWSQPVAVSCQYQKATLNRDAGSSALAGFLFRCSNTTNGSCYRILFDTSDDTIYWTNIPNMTDPYTGTEIASATVAMSPGDTWGVTLELLGNNTIVRIWLNPTGLPARANNWNGDTTPNVTFTQNPATPRDSGVYLGLIGGPLEAAIDLSWDNWFGGGCLESTGALWTRDLFDGLVVNEAFAKVASLFRAYADLITLSENLIKANALVRSYADTLTVGEALSKRAEKVFANAITLGEAFVKQLQVVRSMADSMTLGEAFAKQMQWKRADAIVLSEVLKKQVNKVLVDLITMSEALTKLFSRALSDSISLSEPMLVKLFGKNIANPIVLNEVLVKIKGISKALAETITMGEMLTKVFVGIRSLADPIILGENVSKQLSGLFSRSLSDPIILSERLIKQAQAARQWVDSIILGEVVTKQAQFRRSLADLMTLGEALQKNVVLVRSIANSITMGELVTKSSGFARSRVDPLTLGEALSKVFGFRLSPDLITMTEVLAKSMTFRRSLADLMTMSDAGVRQILRQLLADPITMAELVALSRTFFRSRVDPITMSDAVAKLFVLLRTFSDSLSLDDRLGLITAFRSFASDPLVMSEAMQSQAVLKRSQSDPITLADVIDSRIVTFIPAWASRDFNIGTGDTVCH